jgi:hypothetical protein
MNLAINNDVESLTISEQKTILNCVTYSYDHSKSKFILQHISKVQIVWCPINTTKAHDYLIKNNIKLTLEMF